MSTYQAVYDAVRSKISGGDLSGVADRIVNQFDFYHQAEVIKQELLTVCHEKQRPSVLLNPSISIDGNQWCALYGDNLQDGVAGFGDSPAEAMLDFDKSWVKKLK